MISLQVKTQDVETLTGLTQRMKMFQGLKAINPVTSPQKINVNDNHLYATTYYITFNRNLYQLTELRTFLYLISPQWTWTFSSVVCPAFHWKGWTVSFAEFFPDEDYHELMATFFVMGETQEETIACLKDFDHPPIWRYEFLGAKPYFKIDNCFIITAKVVSQHELNCFAVEELVNLYTRTYSWIGLVVQSRGPFYDEGVVELTASCKLVSG